MIDVTKFEGHTPGPWKVHGGPGRLRHHLAVIDSLPDVEGKVVANCICHIATTNNDSDANAALLAAAPELLAEVLRLRERVKELESFVVSVRDNYDCDSDAHKYGTPCRCCEAGRVLPR